MKDHRSILKISVPNFGQFQLQWTRGGHSPTPEINLLQVLRDLNAKHTTFCKGMTLNYINCRVRRFPMKICICNQFELPEVFLGVLNFPSGSKLKSPISNQLLLRPSLGSYLYLLLLQYSFKLLLNASNKKKKSWMNIPACHLMS